MNEASRCNPAASVTLQDDGGASRGAAREHIGRRDHGGEGDPEDIPHHRCLHAESWGGPTPERHRATTGTGLSVSGFLRYLLFVNPDPPSPCRPHAEKHL